MAGSVTCFNWRENDGKQKSVLASSICGEEGRKEPQFDAHPSTLIHHFMADGLPRYPLKGTDADIQGPQSSSANHQ